MEIRSNFQEVRKIGGEGELQVLTGEWLKGRFNLVHIIGNLEIPRVNVGEIGILL